MTILPIVPSVQTLFQKTNGNSLLIAGVNYRVRIGCITHEVAHFGTDYDVTFYVEIMANIPLMRGYISIFMKIFCRTAARKN